MILDEVVMAIIFLLTDIILLLKYAVHYQQHNIYPHPRELIVMEDKNVLKYKTIVVSVCVNGRGHRTMCSYGDNYSLFT